MSIWRYLSTAQPDGTVPGSALVMGAFAVALILGGCLTLKGVFALLDRASAGRRRPVYGQPGQDPQRTPGQRFSDTYEDWAKWDYLKRTTAWGQEAGERADRP